MFGNSNTFQKLAILTHNFVIKIELMLFLLLELDNDLPSGLHIMPCKWSIVNVTIDSFETCKSILD